jgi:hypothetical protein
MTVTAFSEEGDWNKTISYGTVSYASQNRYYVNQNFIYEGGALILSQGERSSMMLYPSIRISRISVNEYNASIHLVEIDKSVYAPPDVISSNTGCSLRITGEEFKPLYNSDKESSGNISSSLLRLILTNLKPGTSTSKKTIADARITGYSTLTPNGNKVSLTFPSGSGKDLNRLME